MFKKLFFVLTIGNAITAFTVVIDPGHGGKFAGAKSKNDSFFEKEMVLDIGLRLGALLAEQVNVVYTRTSDAHLNEVLQDDLLERVDCARAAKADLFLSLHLNSSSTSPESRGFELYVPMVTQFPLQSYIAAACIHHVFSQKGEKLWGGSLGNLNKLDRGIRAAKFNVLYHNPCPAVLVELDYISNDAGEAYILKSENRQFLAAMLAEGIQNLKALKEKNIAALFA